MPPSAEGSACETERAKILLRVDPLKTLKRHKQAKNRLAKPRQTASNMPCRTQAPRGGEGSQRLNTRTKTRCTDAQEQRNNITHSHRHRYRHRHHHQLFVILSTNRINITRLSISTSLSSTPLKKHHKHKRKHKRRHIINISMSTHCEGYAGIQVPICTHTICVTISNEFCTR